ncbi:MAG: hypothetical protein LBH02_00765 [Methanocalculaceae archaeon]|nr:hypothetical protein [Methanocalculaceae archaeon]
MISVGDVIVVEVLIEDFVAGYWVVAINKPTVPIAWRRLHICVPGTDDLTGNVFSTYSI